MKSSGLVYDRHKSLSIAKRNEIINMCEIDCLSRDYFSVEYVISIHFLNFVLFKFVWCDERSKGFFNNRID